jgi:hypothetical protein
VTEATTHRRVQLVIAAFVLLAVVVVAGDGLGWFETPLPVPLDESDEEPEEGSIDLRATQAACRFGAAISRAGTRGRGRFNPGELADAYADSFEDLPPEDRAKIREACLEGLRKALRSSKGPANKD